MRLNATTGLIILIIGLVVLNYGYLHDLLWQGAEVIMMGVRSYIIVLAGIAVSIVGALVIMRAD